MLPARIEMLLRVLRSRRLLGGFYASGPELTALVPKGKLAVDAGANVGVYSYWMSRSANSVIAFEPQPRLAKRLASSGIANLVVHNVALSDSEGVAELHVPLAHGEASLRDLDVPSEPVRVPLKTLDSFRLENVGFLKVDVEGYEETLLRGAIETLRANDLSIYIEIEERHNPGGLARIVDLLSSLGFDEVYFRQDGVFKPFKDFDIDRDQVSKRPQTSSYANNFLFRRGRT